MISFIVYGTPQQTGSKVSRPIMRGGKPVMKNGRPVVVTNDSNAAEAKPWMAAVRSAAATVFDGELLQGPIRLTVRFYFAHPKSHFRTGKATSHLLSKQWDTPYHINMPDTIKLIRCLEDALTKQVWLDDKQVCQYGSGTGKYWTTEQARAEVMIEDLDHHPQQPASTSNKRSLWL